MVGVRIVHGCGIIDKLPFEIHIPGYSFCGPGTRLEKRLARGEQGINELDQACRQHDIAYSANKGLVERHVADRILADKAKEIRGRRDLGIGQRIAALAVDKIMRGKIKLGLGVNFRQVMNAARNKKKKNYGDGCLKKCIRSSLSSAKSILKKNHKGVGRRRKLIKTPRVLPIPKTRGGIIPFLIPALAGLSAIGSLAGGAAAIAKTVKQVKSAEDQLKEAKRHNKMMEAVAIGKGLYLKPYRKGLGLFIKKKKTPLIVLPNRALTNIDLFKFAKTLEIKHFRGVYMLDTLPNSMLKSYNECVIVNLDSYGGHGTHWVAYIKIVNTVYYFDSF